VRPRTVLDQNSMVGQVVLPFVVNGPIVELDYPDQIPALEQAVAAAKRGMKMEDPEWTRHPA
nr:hypothetical protein [Polyangiaceae bacterium]